MKTGLVLEGGAMRGMYTAGVIDVLMENNIFTHGAIGVSAGAVFGCNYKSRQIGRVIRYNIKYVNDPRYLSFHSLITTGNLFGVDFCYHELPFKLDPFDNETFKNSEMEFYVVATDINTGKPVYHKCTDGKDEDLEWMRASASMPLMAQPVKIKDRLFLDGGISDSIPLRTFQSLGYTKNIVVLTRPSGYVKKKKHFMALNNKYPLLVKALKERADMYNRELKYVEDERKAGSVLVIRPSIDLSVKRTERDPKKLKALYELGRSDAENAIADIKKFVKGRD